VSNRGSARRGE